MGRTMIAAATVLLLASHSGVATAQVGTATLSGAVQDESGGNIPEVKLVIVNLATGSQRRASTNESGMFTIALLPPGTYTLMAERDGFTPAEVRDIVLNVGDELIVKVRLKVAALGEMVTVEAESSRSMSSPAVSTVVDRRFIAELPMNGRSFTSLIQLTPGVVQNTNLSERGQFSVNGQRAGSNSFTIDGVSANVGVQTSGVPGQGGSGALPASTVLGGGNSMVTLDALQEFNLQTSSYAAEYGRTPGAQVSMVTRSGTNSLHGSASEYFRDSALDANDWFANRAGIAKPSSRQHLFGASAGGPVVRSRTFFFGAYEGLRLRQPQTTDTIVPSLAARAAAPAAIRPIFEAYPLPNGPELAGGIARSTASYADPARHDIGSGRIDYVTARAGTYFVRYNESRSTAAQRATSVASLVVDSRSDLRTLTFGATHVLTPRLVNSLRYNVSSSNGGNQQSLESFMGAVAPPWSALFPAGVAEGFAIVNFGTQMGRLTSGVDIDHTLRQHNIVDTLSWSAGAHMVKVGVDYQRLLAGYGADGQVQYRPTYNFASVAAASTLTLSNAIVNVLEQVDLVFDHLSLFAQDTWAASDRLSITYGLRYERVPAPRGARPQDQPFTINSLGQLGSVALAPAGTPLYETTNANFAPRAGIAWRARGESGHVTVIRGGWGLYYDLGTGVVSSAAGAFPFLRTKRLPANTAFPLTAAAAAPLPADAPPPYDLIRAFDPEIRLPRVQQFNATVEQQLGSRQQASIAYVGARGRRLLRQETIANPSSSIASLQLTTNGDRSQYDSLQLQYQRRLSRGLQALASYVLSKSSDTASADGGSLPRSDRLPATLDYGPSDFDVRHAFNAGVSWDLSRRDQRSILGGWGVDAMVFARSGLPVSVTMTRSFASGFVPLRPDRVEGVALYFEDATAPGGRRLNAAAFLVPATEGHGNLPRNALRGFGMSQIDLAVRRTVPLIGSARLTVRAELFNAFHTPIFGQPNGNLGTVSATGVLTPNANFGLATGTLRNGLPGLTSIYALGGPRSGQLSARIEF